MKFIRKNGRVIPIREKGEQGADTKRADTKRPPKISGLAKAGFLAGAVTAGMVGWGLGAVGGAYLGNVVRKIGATALATAGALRHVKGGISGAKAIRTARVASHVISRSSPGAAGAIFIQASSLAGAMYGATKAMNTVVRSAQRYARRKGQSLRAGE